MNEFVEQRMARLYELYPDLGAAEDKCAAAAFMKQYKAFGGLSDNVPRAA